MKLPPEQHALHSVIFGETDSIIARAVAVRPLIFVTENVFGFGDLRSKGKYTDKSPKTVFISLMHEKVRDSGGLAWFGGHADVPTCCGDWIQGRRPRDYIAFWALCAGGATAAASFATRWQDIFTVLVDRRSDERAFCYVFILKRKCGQQWPIMEITHAPSPRWSSLTPTPTRVLDATSPHAW